MTAPSSRAWLLGTARPGAELGVSGAGLTGQQQEGETEAETPAQLPHLAAQSPADATLGVLQLPGCASSSKIQLQLMPGCLSPLFPDPK